MEVDEFPTGKQKDARKMIPEGDAYIKMLTQLVLLDANRLEEGAEFSTSLVESIHSQNRRTLDQIGAKIFFYYSRFYELLGQLASIRPYSPTLWKKLISPGLCLLRFVPPLFATIPTRKEHF